MTCDSQRKDIIRCAAMKRSLASSSNGMGRIRYEWKVSQRNCIDLPRCSYSRMRYVTFVKRCDAPTMIRCLMEAFLNTGGLPKAALTDRMKSVLLEMENKIRDRKCPLRGCAWPPLGWHFGLAKRIRHKRKAKSSAQLVLRSTATGQGFPSPIWMTSIARRTSGVSASMHGCIGRPRASP